MMTITTPIPIAIGTVMIDPLFAAHKEVGKEMV